jgi:hypothetical protein
MNRPGASNAVTFSPLVNQCAETHKMALGSARFWLDSENQLLFFSIEFIEITCLKTIRAFFGIGKEDDVLSKSSKVFNNL